MSAILAQYNTDSVGELLLKLVRRLWPKEGILTLILLLFMMLCAVWSVEAAGWVDRLPSLAMLCLGATLMGFLFAKTRLPWYWTHPVAVLYGAVATIGATQALIDRPELHERLVEFVIRINAWGYAARTGGFSTDPLIFVFWLAILTWVIGYASTWLVFRSHRVWFGILPTAIAILMNLRYALPSATVWFFFFLMFALLLLIRFNVFRQHEAWKKQRVEFNSSIGYSSLPELTVYSFLIALVVWMAPSGGIAPFISDVWNTLTEPYNEFSLEFNRLIGNLNNQTQEGPSTTFSRSLILKGPIKLGTSVIMFVQADEPVYLRATAYDTYNGRGFVTGDKLTVQFPPGSEVPPPSKEYKSRKELQQKISLRATPGNAILAAGIPLRASQRSVAEVDKPLNYTLSLDDSSADAGLPANLKALAPSIREQFLRLRTDNRLGASPAELPNEVARSMPIDVRIDKYVARDGRVTALEVQNANPYPTDFTSIRVPGRGRAPAQYTVASSVSNASESELRRASAEYPGWVAERYLQLPSSVPERVRRLARQLTEGTDNSYDRAVRIQDYLRGFRYNEAIEPPPPTADPLEHFLFQAREGYCDYFSSAMVVMLRSLGVPARIAAGYYTGEFDSNKGYYLVRESNTHAWPEVFFPDYGWIEFEPTPSRPLIARGAGTSDQDIASSGPSSTSSDTPLEDPNFLEEDFGLAGGGVLGDDNSVPVGPFALLGLVGAAGAGWWFWRRGLKGLTAAPLAYEQVRRLASIGFRAQRPAETPVEYGGSLGKVIPAQSGAINRVMSGYTADRYSRSGLDLSESIRLRRAWQELRPALVKLALLRPFRSLFARRPGRSRIR